MMYVISYDICDDGRRSSVAKLLLDHGLRVQKSVFECLLDERRLSALQEKIARVIDPSRDSVRYYQLCRKCVVALEVQGCSPLHRGDDDLFIL